MRLTLALVLNVTLPALPVLRLHPQHLRVGDSLQVCLGAHTTCRLPHLALFQIPEPVLHPISGPGLSQTPPLSQTWHSQLDSVKETESQSQLCLWPCLSPSHPHPFALLWDHFLTGLARPECSEFVSFPAMGHCGTCGHSQEGHGSPRRGGTPRRGPRAPHPKSKALLPLRAGSAVEAQSTWRGCLFVLLFFKKK